MKEKPILFSTPMVRAILDGRKTQTRRIVKPQPYPDLDDRMDPIAKGILLDPLRTVKYQKGMILWVRETWRPTLHSFPIGPRWDYRATAEEDGAPTEGPWKPSIFMPKEASRIRIEITNVRIERLWDISKKDAIAEGVQTLYPVDHYKRLWESINGKGSWNKNPCVWVIQFKKIDGKEVGL